MAQIGVQTSQNVYIEHNIASVGHRMGAKLLDFLFIFVYFLLVIFVMEFVTGDKDVGFMILLIPLVFYTFLFELIFQGQTPGKMILKIKVMKTDGSQPTIFSYLIRWSFNLIEIFPFYGIVAIIMIVANGKGQRTGDIVAKTMVIRLTKAISFADTLQVVTPQHYEVHYQEAVSLSADDIHTINDVLLHHDRNKADNAMELVVQTKAAIERKLSITSKEMNPVNFLRNIKKDYYHLSE